MRWVLDSRYVSYDWSASSLTIPFVVGLRHPTSARPWPSRMSLGSSLAFFALVRGGPLNSRLRSLNERRNPV